MSDSDNNTSFQVENGYVTDDTAADSGDSEPEENASAQNAFDTDLPTIHKYLGKLNNVSGYTLFDEGELLNTIALHTNTLVFPGFTLPLMLQNQYESAVMEKFIETKNTFVLVFTIPDNGLCDYGVTMEIFETTANNGVLCLKAKGRQRCKLIKGSVKQLGGRMLQISVKILPEPPVTSPLENSLLRSLHRTRPLVNTNYDSFLRNYKYRRYHLAQYAQNSFVYDKHEAVFFVKQIIKGLSKFYSDEYLPKDPISLSYWFVQNFQLTQEERVEILKLNSALERLRRELKFLNMQRVICCDLCEVVIAQQNDVFAMSKDGIQSNYCNPGGYVFETITVSKAKNYQLTGRSSKEFSWFPGYAWTIMQCKICKEHLGWQFSSKHLQPSTFFGLAKSGVDIKIIHKDNGD